MQSLIQQALKHPNGFPPVDKWNPELCEGVSFEVDRNGQWSYNGSVIKRKRLVDLFCTILRRDQDGQYYCVTPFEKVLVQVAFAPLQVVALELKEEKYFWVTSDGSAIPFEAGHELALLSQDDELVPVVRSRGRVWAFFTRSLYYEISQKISYDEHNQVILSGWGKESLPLTIYQAQQLP